MSFLSRAMIFGAFALVSVMVVASHAAVDVDMVLNDGGFITGDHFKAELKLINSDAEISDALIFGILELYGAFYYWPDYGTDVNYQVATIAGGETRFPFLEFDFPDIDDIIPLGPMNFWGAWYLDADTYGFDVEEFWLDTEHKWTPVPTVTPTSQVPTATPTSNVPTPTVTPGTAPDGFVYIAPGTFTMGSPQEEACRANEERQHSVTLTRGVFFMETEVTRQMWADLQTVQPTLPNDPSDQGYSETLAQPIQSCTFFESVLFANLLSSRDGLTPCYYKDAGFTTVLNATNYTSGPLHCNFDADGYRLPTEAEWEYTCRAGTIGPFHCDEPLYTSANCYDFTPGIHPTLEQYCVYGPVTSTETWAAGSKLPNDWGVYDMHGNVWERCWDWWSAYPAGAVTDPVGPANGIMRIGRGGSMSYHGADCRSAYRFAFTEDDRFFALGFRLVRSVVE